MKCNTWPLCSVKQRRIHAWRPCPAFSRLDLEKHWSPKTRVTRSMRRLEACSSGSEPVAGPSGLQQTSRTAQGSDGRVLSGKRKREDAFEMDQERAGPSKKSRSSPENISIKRKTPNDDSAGEDEQSCGRSPKSFQPLRSVPAETVPGEEAIRNVDELFRKYEISEKIGAGGFGTVYAGRRIEDDFPVAIKIIERKYVPYVETKVDGVKRILPKEVALLLHLEAGPENSSCSITPLLLDWYELSEKVVLVFERPQPCRDLLAHISSSDIDSTVEEAKIIFRQLVEQAIEMEARGVFHKDIKPENILLDTGSGVLRARFIDFGSATTFTPEQIFNEPQGTSAYTSPEWFRDTPYNASPVTVWQLGLVLYGFLFYKRPLVKEFTIGSRRAVSIPRTVPEDCRRILKGCLAKDPNERLTLEDLRNHPWLTSE